MSVIITDERAQPIAEAIRESHRGADMLALMQAKPEIFRQMLELPPRKMEYRLNQLEDSIDNMYKALEAKKAEESRRRNAPNRFRHRATSATTAMGTTGFPAFRRRHE